MEPFILPLTGGLLLGASAMWLLFSMGRIAGISGVIWGAVAGPVNLFRKPLRQVWATVAAPAQVLRSWDPAGMDSEQLRP